MEKEFIKFLNDIGLAKDNKIIIMSDNDPDANSHISKLIIAYLLFSSNKNIKDNKRVLN